jgi:peptide/nickel transport system substrate-binding protein
MGPNGEKVPMICDEEEVVDDTTIQISLREETQYFHDGTEITIEDLKYSLDLQSQPDELYAATTQYLVELESTEIVDDRTLQCNLSEPSATYSAVGLTSAYVLPEHWVSEWSEPKLEHTFNGNESIGSGQYELEQFRLEEELVMSRFDDFIDPAASERGIRVGGPVEAQLRVLEDGELDCVAGEGLTVGTIESTANADNLEIREAPTHGITTMFNNNNKPPFDDRAFRRAAANVIPKQEMHDAIFRGYGNIISSPIPPANEEWHNPDVEQFGDDPEAAREELEEAGYQWDDDGVLHYPN